LDERIWLWPPIRGCSQCARFVCIFLISLTARRCTSPFLVIDSSKYTVPKAPVPRLCLLPTVLPSSLSVGEESHQIRDTHVGYIRHRILSLVLSLACYGSVKNGFDSAILTKIPRMEKKKGLGRRQATKCDAKCQARTLVPGPSHNMGYLSTHSCCSGTVSATIDPGACKRPAVLGEGFR
jgi:hypothetical protein